MTRQVTTAEERYERLVETLLTSSEATRSGKGFGASALKTHGKIFAMLAGGKLVVKLPRARVDALIAAGDGAPYDPRKDGRIMKEWVAITTATDDAWLRSAREALAFVVSHS